VRERCSSTRKVYSRDVIKRHLASLTQTVYPNTLTKRPRFDPISYSRSSSHTEPRLKSLKKSEREEKKRQIKFSRQKQKNQQTFIKNVYEQQQQQQRRRQQQQRPNLPAIAQSTEHGPLLHVRANDIPKPDRHVRGLHKDPSGYYAEHPKAVRGDTLQPMRAILTTTETLDKGGLRVERALDVLHKTSERVK